MNCPACLETKNFSERPYRNDHWPDIKTFNDRKIVKCLKCGLGFISVDFSNKFLSDFYSHIYRAKGSPYYIDFNNISIDKGPNARARGQIELASKFVSVLSNDIFIDIGPGTGHSFMAAEKQFPNIEKVAIELTEGIAEVYKNLYKAKTFDSINSFLQRPKRAKIVLMSHCLEHINPSEVTNTLKELSLLLATDGILLVEVPNVDFPEGKTVFQDAPHCLFFTKQSLELLFKKNGWRVLFVETTGPTYYQYEENLKRKRLARGARLSRIIARFRNVTLKSIQSETYAISEREDIDPSFIYGGPRTSLRLVAQPL